MAGNAPAETGHSARWTRHHGYLATTAREGRLIVQPTLEPLRRWDPEQIGPYPLLGRLGAGAMGQVFLGRSAAGRLVAVKTIKIEFAEEAGFRARFAQEVAAARRVSGAFTAAVVAADPEADMPWLATAYVPAPSLTRLVRSCGPLPVAATRWLAAGCAEALESIHSAGLVHRDLKPSNVLVAPDGPRVIDFGVARAAERIQLTVTNGAVGTPAYMAPEQARDTRQASTASDMFSLGATLLFAATGHAPYQGETVMDVLVRLATEPPDLAGLPAELTDMVTACLERSPRKRPASAALLAQLGPFVDSPAAGGGGHSYLTDAAMELIEEYRHGPQLADGSYDEEASGDATFGSRTALPVPRERGIRRWLPWWAGTSPGGSGDHPRHPPRKKSRRGPALGLAGRAAVAVALVAAGAGIGILVSMPGTTSPSPHTPGGPRGSSLPPPPGQLPPTAFAPIPSGRAAIEPLQPVGDSYTVFVLHGVGWIPLTRVTVTLLGLGVSRDRQVVDGAGTFNCAIGQGYDFFPGRIPPGSYTVVATGAGGRRATATFRVRPPPTPSPAA
jgi:serine/threonine protein kinase